MTFDEMKYTYDKYNAYSNYLPVEHAKILEIIPKDYQEYFPNECTCGSENIITSDLTTICCCNPKCPNKQALGLANLFSKFECKGVGEALCKKVYSIIMKVNQDRIDRFEEPLLKTGSYVEILLLKRTDFPPDFNCTSDGILFHKCVESIREKVMTFPEMISKLGLPELDTSALKLFNGINSFQELKDAILACGDIKGFCYKHNVYDAMKMYWLYVSLEDIYVATCLFSNVRAAGIKQLSVCITGSLFPYGNRMTKKAFVDFCNKACVTRKMSDVIAECLEEKGESFFNQYKDSIKIFLHNNDLYCESNSYGEVLQELKDYDGYGIQLVETQISSAKMSAPYIIADAPSNSAKYLAGLDRGIEKNADGTERKVLISSEEYIEIIKEMIKEWENKLKEHFLSEVTTMNPMTIF